MKDILKLTRNLPISRRIRKPVRNGYRYKDDNSIIEDSTSNLDRISYMTMKVRVDSGNWTDSIIIRFINTDGDKRYPQVYNYMDDVFEQEDTLELLKSSKFFMDSSLRIEKKSGQSKTEVLTFRYWKNEQSAIRSSKILKEISSIKIDKSEYL